MSSAVIWRCTKGTGVTASWNKASAFSVEKETGEKIMGAPLCRRVSTHGTDLQAIRAAKKLSKQILREQQQPTAAEPIVVKKRTKRKVK